MNKSVSLFIDTHAHIYPCYDLSLFFTSFVRNVERMAPHALPLMILTERASEHYFDLLRTGQVLGDAVHILDPQSLAITLPGGNTVWCFAGQQSSSEEGLEVLSLGRLKPLPLGMPFEELVHEACTPTNDQLPCLAVVPWSFGKWTSSRGRKIHSFLRASPLKNVFVGDVSGRHPLIGRIPPSPYTVLSGSDPLPLRGEERMVGTGGVLISTPRELPLRWECLAELLSEHSFQNVGGSLPLGTVLLRQLRLRWNTLAAKTSGNPATGNDSPGTTQ